MEQLSELKAAGLFLKQIHDESQKVWPKLYSDLKNTFRERFVIDDETFAIFDLMLAAVSQELIAINNIFHKDQADRLRKWVFKMINEMDWGEYSVKEIKSYENYFQSELKDMNEGGNPISAISGRLLVKWLGKRINDFKISAGDHKAELIDPILLMIVTNSLISMLGYWKRLKDNYILIEEDLPFNYNFDDLKDYSPDIEENVPDGTFRFEDKNGSLKEGWMPPKDIDEMIKKGDAKFAYKVLIRGPWNGIKQDIWELSSDIVNRFVDQNGLAYALCYYMKGERKYIFVTKKIWDRASETFKIFKNTTLSREQIKERINEIVNNILHNSNDN